MEPNLMDEIDCGNLFDQIEDLIDFPPDDDCADGNLVSSSECKDFPTWDEALQGCDSLFSGGHAVSDYAAELSVPYEDIVQLEWLSNFVEDSFSDEGLTLRKENLRVNTDDSSPTQFHISSPVSMLESSNSSSSSSSSSIGKTMALGPSHRGPQRARSKRPRPATSNRRPAIQLVSPSSSSMETPKTCTDRGFSSESNSFTESPPIQKPEQKKPKKIKIASPAYPNAVHEALSSQTIRKCLHCQITKTPQWRAGPMGPKTLCNACGVRYKSGRLFPEYRPAASPTFVPSMHSNSHKKVLQMRSKLDPEFVPTASLR